MSRMLRRGCWLLVLVLVLPGWARAADWSVELSVGTPVNFFSGRMAETRLIAAADPAATDGYDHAFDTIALVQNPFGAAALVPDPFPQPDLLEVYFQHDFELGYTDRTALLWQDVRGGLTEVGASKAWVVEAASSSPGRPVMLTWRVALHRDCQKYRFTLTDETSLTALDMTRKFFYAYQTPSTASQTSPTTRRFTLLVTRLAVAPVPTQPIGLFSPRGTSRGVLLSWGTTDTLDALAGFHVYRRTDLGQPPVRLTESPVAETAYLDAAVTSGVTYDYVVTAVNLDGCESGSSAALAAAAP